MTTDYKSSVFLPKTDFPMRGGLPKKEPELLKRWADMHLFERQRAESKGRPKFVLHDGPPYANGNLHIGHALNKILKDLVSRTQQMLGKDSHYVPGWDCHGLPIEWKIEEEYRAKNQDKDDVPVGEFRRQCRAFADHWIGVQREEFKRLGVEGDWDNYYSTMAYSSEAVIANELGKFLMNGGLYKGSKAVLWSRGREDGAGRGRDRVSRPHLRHGPCALPGPQVEGRQARRRVGRDLDHDSLDHPGQPCAGLRPRHRLRAGRSRGGGRGQPRPGRREDGAGQGAAWVPWPKPASSHRRSWATSVPPTSKA